MPSPHEQQRGPRRYIVVLLSIAACFLGLLLQLFSLQIVKGNFYRHRLDRQSVRILWLPALRGKIFDRHMQLVADNRLAFDVDLMVSDLTARQRTNTVKTLAVLLRVPEGSIWSNIMPGTHFPYTPARVARDLPFPQMLHVAERLTEMPGVDLAVNPVRVYPFGASACHAIGYVGCVPTNHPKLLSGEYTINDLVGMNGIEKVCEDVLHGSNGERIVQVDRASRFVETLDQRLPVRGQDIMLTLDMKLQRVLEQAFSNRPGAAAAVDPRSGEVLALVSSPGFDINTFVGGVSVSSYRALLADAAKPLMNRSTHGQYQLGSVFKLITSIAALEGGVLTPTTVFNDTGRFELGSMTVHNFGNHHYGPINIIDALRVSCNAFFCTYSVPVGVTRLVGYGNLFRLGTLTGIEIGEAKGILPNPGWKRAQRHLPWCDGDTVNLSIGQGDLLVTPIQVACMVAAIANGGVWCQPYLLSNTFNGCTPIMVPLRRSSVPIPLQATTLATVHQGMWEVVNGHQGSGRLARLPTPVAAGKTGSAKLTKELTYGWFAGYAPFDDPQIAIAIVVENAETGGKDAAPIFRQAVASYFNVALNVSSNAVDHSHITD